MFANVKNNGRFLLLLALTFLISGSTTVNAKPKFDVKSTPSNQIEIDKYKALVKKPPMIIF